VLLPSKFVLRTAPELPSTKQKLGRLNRPSGIKTKRDALREHSKRQREMKNANKETPQVHSIQEMDEVAQKIQQVRDKLHQAQRRASGLPQATKDQRTKVREMKAANKAVPGLHSKDEISVEMGKLRELMCKFSKRKLVLPIKKTKKTGSRKRLVREGVSVSDSEDSPRARYRVPPPPSTEGWRRCNCAQNGHFRCSCHTATTYDWPCTLPTLSEIRQSQDKTSTESVEEKEAVNTSKLTGAKLLAAKGLDIEQLKVEVEKRGGFEKVQERREWRQIARAMNVPPNTCADHLRRQYLNATTVPAALRFPQPQADGSLVPAVPARTPKADGASVRARKPKKVKSIYGSACPPDSVPQGVSWHAHSHLPWAFPPPQASWEGGSEPNMHAGSSGEPNRHQGPNFCGPRADEDLPHYDAKKRPRTQVHQVQLQTQAAHEWYAAAHAAAAHAHGHAHGRAPNHPHHHPAMMHKGPHSGHMYGAVPGELDFMGVGGAVGNTQLPMHHLSMYQHSAKHTAMHQPAPPPEHHEQQHADETHEEEQEAEMEQQDQAQFQPSSPSGALLSTLDATSHGGVSLELHRAEPSTEPFAEPSSLVLPPPPVVDGLGDGDMPSEELEEATSPPDMPAAPLDS